MGGVVDFPGARNRVLLAAWKGNEAGWCAVANASRRAMRNWYRLDRGANRQGFVALAVGAAFGFDPATVRIEPPEDDAALRRFILPTPSPRTLEPHEHTACVRYWRERLHLLAKLAEAVQGARPSGHHGYALREIRRERRLTLGILAEMGAELECVA